VLGRGGEEVLALSAAGVPHEVIPGVSSALAAPALAGIPLTHRGLASGFAVLSGHAEEAWRPILAAVAPGSLSLVVLMGLAARAELAAALLARGWDPATPSALLLAASTPRAAAWLGPLAALPRAPIADASHGAPATLVIGAVADLPARAAALSAAAATRLAEAPPDRRLPLAAGQR
jgi:uroporphyrin-III C-methyltransferase/precorrin-2 dehydrogenase/sirohydrochlorin ferrochelatase